MDRIQEIRKKDPSLAKALDSIDPNLSRTLISSIYTQKSVEPKERALTRLRSVVADLQRDKKVVTVAVWDLDTKVGGLPEVIGALNKAQSVFTFFELRAPVPAGLVIHSELFSQWSMKRLGKQVSKRDQADFNSNLMFNDFYKYARGVRQDIGVDYLVGVTQYMVAGEEDGELYWNYFTTSDRRIVLASAYEMREYAQKAGRPVEVAVAGIIIAQLLTEVTRKELFHEETRGCLFDFNDNRETVVESIRETRIEPECLSKISPVYRDATQKLVKVLRNYSSKEAVAEQTPVKSNKGDEYWLHELAKLSSRLTTKNKK
jgi:hypothetical protein